MRGQIFRFVGLLGVLSLILTLGPSRVWGAYDSRGNRDPFVPLLTPDGRRIYPPGSGESGPQAESAGLTLEGIVFEPGKDSVAIINDQVVRENDEFDGIRVMKITQDAVVVLVDGEEKELVVYQPTEENTLP